MSGRVNSSYISTAPSFSPPRNQVVAVVRVAVTGLTTVLLLSGCVAESETATGAAQQWAGGGYEPSPITYRDAAGTRRIRGRVRVDGAVEIGSEISGRLVEVLVEEGDQVEEGQLLARLNAEFIGLRLQQIEAQRETLRTRLEASRLRLQLAEDVSRRNEQLAERTLLPERELMQSRTELELHRLDVRAADAELRVIEATYQRTRLELERTEVFSPVTGQVTRKNVSVGETINAAQSTPVLFEVTPDNSEISVYAELSEYWLNFVTVGDPITVAPGLSGASELDCSLDQIFRRPIQRANYVFYGAVVSCAEAPTHLWSGMTVDLHIPFTNPAPAALIPVEALDFSPTSTPENRSEQGASIWVIDTEERLVQRSLQIGFRTARYIEVIGGDLLPTDRILLPKNDT